MNRPRTLAAFVTTVLLAGCSGGEPAAEATDTGAEMSLTLTDDGCTYEGDETPAAGMFTVDVENQTAYFGAFALAALAEGSTIEDLEPFLGQARRQFKQNGTLPELPPFYTQVVRVGAASGKSSVLPADVTAGRYALMCFIDDLPTWQVYLARQLDVTG